MWPFKKKDLPMSSSLIDNTIALLGLRATDKVTGFQGVISSVGFDLYGCVVAILTPPIAEGKHQDGHWFDVQRLEVGTERVMAVPAFSTIAREPAEYSHGAAEKPYR